MTNLEVYAHLIGVGAFTDDLIVVYLHTDASTKINIMY